MIKISSVAEGQTWYHFITPISLTQLSSFQNMLLPDISISRLLNIVSTDKQTEGGRDRWREGQMDGWTDRWTDDRPTEGRTDGWMEGQTDGLTDRQR